MTWWIAPWVQLLADTITSWATLVDDGQWTAINWTTNIVSSLATLILLGFTVWSTLESLKETRRTREQTEKLERQRLEYEVLREDTLSTSLPVYSSDNFAKCQHAATWPLGTLKVFSDNKGLTWKYKIVDTYNIIFPMGTFAAIQEAIIHDSDQEKRLPQEFVSKHACIAWVMTYFELKNYVIKWKKPEELEWYNAPEM